MINKIVNFLYVFVGNLYKKDFYYVLDIMIFFKNLKKMKLNIL